MKQPRLEHIHIDQIDFGTRYRQKYEGIQDLAQNIKEFGLIQPLALIPKDKIRYAEETEDFKISAPYMLVAGGRRYTAIREYKVMEEVPCRIYDEEITEDVLREIELYENLFRKDLTWQERTDLVKEIHRLQISIKGKAIRGVPEDVGHSIEDTAKMLNKSKSSVADTLQLAEAMEKLPQLREAKTASEAKKMLKKLSKMHETKKKAKKLSDREGGNMNEAKRKLINSFIIQDVLEGIKNVPDRSIDIIELDPPYAVDLGTNKNVSKDLMIGYNEVDAVWYRQNMPVLYKEFYRVLKNNGWIVSWFGSEPWFGEILQWMRDAGFSVRGVPGIWSKHRGGTNQPLVYLANSYEMFFYGRKGNATVKRHMRLNVFDYLPVKTNNKVHSTERPIEMIQDLLTTFTGGEGKVLVPFLGSGNTILAADNLGMEAFGFELTSEFKDQFTVTVNEGEIGKWKSYEDD